MKIKVILVFLFLKLCMFSQHIDSLKKVLQNTKQDTSRFYWMEQIAVEEYNIRPGFWDTLRKEYEQHLNKSKNFSPDYLFYKKHLSGAICNIGFGFDQQGDIVKALPYYLEGLKVAESNLSADGKFLDKKGMADAMNQIAYAYNKQGDVVKGIEYNLRSLKINEELQEKKSIAQSLNNLALLYKFQGEIDKSLEFNLRSLKIRQELGDKIGEGFSINNIASVFLLQGDTAKALEYYNKSLKLREEIKDLKGVGQCLNNIGVVYDKMGDNKKSMEYYEKSLKLQQEINDKMRMVFTLVNIGNLYFKQKNLQQAEVFGLKSLQLALEFKTPENIKTASKLLYEIYKIKGNKNKALDMFEQYVLMRDSINNIETRKASIKSQFKYQYDKKAAADSVAFAKEKDLKEMEIAKQEAELKAKRNQQYALYGGLILVMIFAGFMVQRFRISNQQKKLIEKQKIIVEVKQKEILDSIHYAKRIQTALMSNEKYIDKTLNKLQKDLS